MNITVGERLIGALPKVGIRPAVDGRVKGVREIYEEPTMLLAKKTAAFISENVRHPNGLPVQCVIADKCIGGAAESAMCADQFSRENVGLSLTISKSWCYGAETMDMTPCIPKAVWGTSGSDIGGAVYLTAVLAAHDQKGLPAFMIYSREVQDKDDYSIPDDVKASILQFVKAGIAVAYIKDKSYLSVGGTSMGIAGSMVDQNFFQSYLGMRNESVDMSEFIRRIEEKIFDEQEYEDAIKWTRSNCAEGEDTNPEERQHSRAQKDAAWETSVKMAMIMRDLMVGNQQLNDKGYEEEALGHNAVCAGFQGQRHWTDQFPVGDYMEAILNSSFDWTGIRQPYILATENDSLNAAAMLFGHMLTGSAQIFADMRTYWSPESVKRVTGESLTGRAKDGMIHLLNSGPAALDGTGEQTKEGQPVIKPFYELNQQDAERCMAAVKWRTADAMFFNAGGYSTEWLTKGEMPITLIRLNIVKELGPVMKIAEGYAVNIPEKIHTILNARTTPTWPTTWFVPNITGRGAFKDVYSVMARWGANHGSFSYGHIGAELITLASMLRIPVSIHNVDDKRIFRPSSWDAFGTDDLENADYRACKAYGALYK